MPEFTVDLSRASIRTKITPGDRWGPPELLVEGTGTTVILLLSDDQLDEIMETIQRHLDRQKSAESA